ncbi:MAG: hypothetical protein HZA53_14880 [Planctomycetes bacterium]|nr:hypothetical protein [Planctomycetota bacterium]
MKFDFAVSSLLRSFASLMLLVSYLMTPSSVHAQCLSWNANFPNVFSEDAWALYSRPVSPTGPELYAGTFYPFQVRMWNGTAWSDFGVGPGVDPADHVSYLIRFNDGMGVQLYAGGRFRVDAPGVLNDGSNIAKWTGTQWVAVGGGLGSEIRCLANLLTGSGNRLYAGGTAWGAPLIRSWNGSSWSELGTGVSGGSTIANLMIWDSGTGPELYVAGYFFSAGGIPVNGMAKWDGLNWSSTGCPLFPAASAAMAVFDDGSGIGLFAVLTTGSIIHLYKYDGFQWVNMGASPDDYISSLAVFDDGSGPALYASGDFLHIGGIAAARLAKYDGQQWYPVGGGLNYRANVMVSHDDGSGPALFLSGEFSQVGAMTAYNFAVWRGCEAPVDAFCFGDGTTAECPCANRGALGRGCAWHNGPTGAVLVASGAPDPDSIVLAASGMPLSAPSTVFLKGDQVLDAAIPFGDGLRCVGGSLIRLGTKTNVNGNAQFPEVGNPSISARGGTPPGSGMIGYYQTWYRNAAVYCTPETYNVTNGVRIVW